MSENVVVPYLLAGGGAPPVVYAHRYAGPTKARLIFEMPPRIGDGRKHVKIEREPRVCGACGVSFVPRTIRSRYCTRTCAATPRLSAARGNGRVRLSMQIVNQIIRDHKCGESVGDIARRIGVSYWTARDAITGHTWSAAGGRHDAA
jgi:hypothetical protein